MRFQLRWPVRRRLDARAAKARESGDSLTRAGYLQLEAPSKREPARLFASVDNGLFDAVVNRCVDTDRLCMDQMMAYDAMGGLGLDAIDALVRPRRGDLRAGPFVASEVCTVEDLVAVQALPASPGGLKSP